ncbi:PREDICTED: 39S ribosomal protein L23, mitochondrial isoform X2 [Dinoponera quadriceps]|nr:PREDICTED: 39S ribosomal protein L23, mitochondrial isoform X2 [Dinoponera quadriceps]XP_014474466.1 PREDICTED: 39S ribosomal protein L23, mitochondrial isoform X2 [Dinoponera quadriceps]
MKLIAPTYKQPSNVVNFHCSMEMTKHDVKNYLEKIYNVKVMFVRTRIAAGKTKKHEFQSGAIIKEDDRKLAYVGLPKDQSFVFPQLFKEAQKEVDEDNVDKSKADLKNFIDSSKAPGLPPWFRM